MEMRSLKVDEVNEACWFAGMGGGDWFNVVERNWGTEDGVKDDGKLEGGAPIEVEEEEAKDDRPEVLGSVIVAGG